MKRFLKVALSGILWLALAIPTLAADPVPNTHYEQQAWWRQGGITVPTAVGKHIHAEVDLPSDGYPINGPFVVVLKITLHDYPGRIDWVEIQEFSQAGQGAGTVKVNYNLGPCSNCSATINIPINWSNWRTGRHEVRVRVNDNDSDPALANSQRMFVTSGLQVCVRTCDDSYRSGPWNEARSWYQNVGYANSRITSPASSVREGGSVTFYAKPGSGGRTTKYVLAAVDPKLHEGVIGLVLLTRNSQCSPCTVTIPNLPAGPHKLMILSHDGQNAGVKVVQFVAN